MSQTTLVRVSNWYGPNKLIFSIISVLWYSLYFTNLVKQKTIVNINQRQICQYDDCYLEVNFTWVGNAETPLSLYIIFEQKLANSAMAPSKLKKNNLFVNIIILKIKNMNISKTVMLLK